MNLCLFEYGSVFSKKSIKKTFFIQRWVKYDLFRKEFYLKMGQTVWTYFAKNLSPKTLSLIILIDNWNQPVSQRS